MGQHLRQDSPGGALTTPRSVIPINKNDSLTHSLKHAVRYDDHDGVGDDGDHVKVQHPDRVPKPEGEEDVACKELSLIHI